MVAYSFKRQFVVPILSGTKRQTIRADRKRHAREGEELQLYTGMRTKQCRLVGRGVCNGVTPIRLDLRNGRVESLASGLSLTMLDELDAFAQRDGFLTWRDLLAFWKQEHGTIEAFSGVLITWWPLASDRRG